MIYINYKEKGVAYEISKTGIIPAANDGQLLQNPEENVLVLYTCWPPDSTTERYVVYGQPKQSIIFVENRFLPCGLKSKLINTD